MIRFKDFDEEYIRSVATQNGFEYHQEMKSNDEESSLYSNPKTNTTELYRESGTIDGLPFEYYLCEYTPITNLKHADSRLYVQIFAVTVPYEVDDLYVESQTNVTLTNVLGMSSIEFQDAQRVQLEGDFNDFFRVSVPNGESLNAFTILGPNIMVHMLNRGSDYDFEFSRNKNRDSQSD